MSTDQNDNLLLRLPDELLDDILSQIDLLYDLTALALTSRSVSRLAIPRHTQYRIIRVRYPVPFIWAHLARRADLARNIREVHLCERHNRSAPDRFPSTLLDKSIDGDIKHAEEDNRISNLCMALRHMRLLHVFTWSWNVSPVSNPTVKSEHEDFVMQILSQKDSLKHLGLSGRFGAHTLDESRDPESLTYPVCISASFDQGRMLTFSIFLRSGNFQTCAPFVFLETFGSSQATRSTFVGCWIGRQT